MNRRQALGRLSLVAAGTLVASTLSPARGLLPVAQAAPTTDLYRGPILTAYSDDPQYGVDCLGATIAAVLIHLPKRDDPVRLWVNVDLVRPERRADVETWARREIGEGSLFGSLDVDELAGIVEHG